MAKEYYFYEFKRSGVFMAKKYDYLPDALNRAIIDIDTKLAQPVAVWNSHGIKIYKAIDLARHYEEVKNEK